MFRVGFAWWPSDEWTFVMEFVADSSFVRVLWSISQACRNQQEMRHTAVSQLNSSFFTKDTFTLSSCWKPLLHVSSTKHKPRLSNNFAFASKILCDMSHMWRDCSKPVIYRVQFCFLTERNRERQGSHRSYVLFATDCAQTAHEAKNINSIWRDVLVSLHSIGASFPGLSSFFLFLFCKKCLRYERLWQVDALTLARRQLKLALDQQASAQKQVDMALENLRTARVTGDEEKVKEAKEEVKEAEEKAEKAEEEANEESLPLLEKFAGELDDLDELILNSRINNKEDMPFLERWRRRSGWKSTSQESFVCGALEGQERPQSLDAWPRWMNMQKADDVDACWYSTQHGFPHKCRLKPQPLRWCLPWSYGTFCSSSTATALSWQGRWWTSTTWISRMWSRSLWSRSSNVFQNQ